MTAKAKRCTYCGALKPIDEFYLVSHKRPNGSVSKYRISKCKECDNKDCRQRHAKRDPREVRDTYLRNKYGITLVEYEYLLEAQDDCCAICGAEEPGITHQDNQHLL
jgi:hypothetical protein